MPATTQGAVAKRLADEGFRIIATEGTHKYLEEQGIPSKRVLKVAEGRPHIVDSIKNREVQLVFNTTEGPQSLKDSFSIRRTTLVYQVPYFTTVAAAAAVADAVVALRGQSLNVASLQEYHADVSGLAKAPAPR